MVAVLGLLLPICLVTPDTAKSIPELDADGRPILSGAELVHDSPDGRFRLHYTLSGADALEANEVDVILAGAIDGLTRVHDAFVTADGWPAPPSDGALGGDARLDLYLRALDANGYAHGDATGCWMEVDPAALGFGEETFRSVVGHEYHHCLQFTVGGGAVGNPFLYEGTSTYAQYLLFDDDAALDIARQVLWQIRLGGAERPLTDTGDRFEYGAMLWFKFLLDHAGVAGTEGGADRKKLLELWQAMADAGSMVAGHDAVLPALFGLADYPTAAARFAAWNLFACQRDDGLHYDPATLPCTLDFAVAPVVVSAYPASGTSADLGHLGSTYVELRPDCTSAALHLTAITTGAAHLQVVEIAAGGASVVQEGSLVAAGELAFDVGDWNHRRRVVLVATNLDGAGTQVGYTASTAGSYSAPASQPAVSALRFESGIAVTLPRGATHPLRLLADFGTCEDGRDVTATVAWQSSDPAVATVLAGVVTAVGPGTAHITATADGVTSPRVRIEVEAAESSGGCAVVPGAGDPWLLLVALGVLARRRR
jgi:Bacterial Ig-like domain (group 2)